jgi:hypothetical protein
MYLLQANTAVDNWHDMVLMIYHPKQIFSGPTKNGSVFFFT